MHLFKLMAAACVAVLSLGAVSVGVEAHSNPVRFTPSPGSVLESAPESVTGWFTSELRREDDSFIRVLDQDGHRVDLNETVLNSDRRQMSVALEPDLGPGRYLVHWSTHDDGDGEVFSGCFFFFVGQAAADAALTEGVSLDGGAMCAAAGDPHDEDAPMGGMDGAPSIEIDVPSISPTGNVMLVIEPTNFTPRAPDGNTVDPNFGHYHIYLDKVPLDLLSGSHDHGDESHEAEAGGNTSEAGEDPNGLIENPVMWFENSYEFLDLAPGFHTVTVVLNYDNHDPLAPPVLASRTFQVVADGDDGVPFWSLLVAGGFGVLGFIVGGFALLTRRN